MEKIFQNRKIALAFLWGLGFLVYFNALNGAFVSDDVTGILKNPQIGQPIRYLLAGNLPNFTLSLNYLIAKYQPFIYHLSNLCFHLIVVALVYFLLLQIANWEIGFLASVLFAVHPIHTEVVSWISGRPYSLGAIFLLASLLLYIHSFKKEKFNKISYIFSLISFVIAQFAEVKSIAFFIIFGLYEITFGRFSRNWKKIIPYGLITLFFLVRLFSSFQARIASENPEYTGESIFFNPLYQIPIALTSYLELFIWPINLSLYHEDLTFSKFSYLLRLIIVIMLFGCLPYFYRKEKLIFFGFLFFILTLTPTLLPVHIAWVVAERYVYLGSMGLCLVASWLLVKILKKYSKEMLFVGGIIIFLFSIRTIARNRDWRTHESIWTATVKASPTSAKAWNNMGDIYAQKKDYQSAIAAFKLAIELRPNYLDAYHNLGVTYLEMKDFDNAIHWFEKALAIYPLSQTYNDMGVAYFYRKDTEKAEECFKKAIEINPGDDIPYHSLGILYYDLGRTEEARRVWEKALSLNPLNWRAKEGLMMIEQRIPATSSAFPQR